MNNSNSTVINIHNLHVSLNPSGQSESCTRILELEQALWEALGCWKFDGVTDQHECIYLTAKRVLGRDES